MRSSHVQTETGIKGLGEDGVGWVQDELGEEDLVRAFVDLGATY